MGPVAVGRQERGLALPVGVRDLAAEG
jgi:hypothetical protein